MEGAGQGVGGCRVTKRVVGHVINGPEMPLRHFQFSAIRLEAGVFPRVVDRGSGLVRCGSRIAFCNGRIFLLLLLACLLTFIICIFLCGLLGIVQGYSCKEKEKRKRIVYGDNDGENDDNGEDLDEDEDE